MTVETDETRTATVNGRTVAWTRYGDPAGRPVVYFHGAGGSRLEGAVLSADAAAAGLRIISVDRPGSGRTDPLPQRTLLDSVADLAAVLDAEGIDSVAVSGLSAGAMYAWASAAAYPERVCGIVTISPAVPCDRPEVRGALSAQFRLTAFLATRLPKVLLAMQRSAFNKTSGANGQQLMIKRMRRISPADVPVVSDPENFADLVRTMTEGRRQGIYGGDEFALMTRPWGFDPAASAVPCTLIHGADDPLTPAIARWASNAPNVVVRQVAGGHLLTATGEGRAAVIDALGSTCG